MVFRIKWGRNPEVTLKEHLKAKRRRSGVTIEPIVEKVIVRGVAGGYHPVTGIAAKAEKKGGVAKAKDHESFGGIGMKRSEKNGQFIATRTKIRGDVRQAAIAAAARTLGPAKG